jgi:hypothetical protein
MDENKKKEAFQVGLGVLIVLAVLTVGEYLIGSVASSWGSILLGIALIKAYFVVRDYMHLPRLFAGEEEIH